MDGVIFFMVIAILICIAVSCFYMAAVTGKAWKAGKRQRKLDKAKGIKRFSAIDHIEGLNAVTNSKCEVVLSSASLMITCAGKQYTLPIERIKYVDFKMDIDEKLYQKSSFVKGIAGAAMFGVAGAVIGSAPKTKSRRYVKGYAVIGYRDTGGMEKVILLRDSAPNSYRCSTLVDTLRSYVHLQVEKIEL